MRAFNYKARDTTDNKVKKGVVQASSETVAGKLLIERGYVPISIEEVDENSFMTKLNSRVSSKDKIVFTRQFATLLGAGLPLAQSLATISEQTSNNALKLIVDDILASIEAGKNLSEAFSKHPEVFDKVYLALVAAGEASGTLDDSLRRIAAQQEKDAIMMSKIRGAMTYPAIVLVVIIIVIIFMLFTVVPQVVQLYDDMNQSLPTLTRLMTGAQQFIVQFWWLIVVAGAIGIWGIGQYFRTEAGIKTADTLKLSAPLFSPLFRRLYMARFARTSQILLGTGVAMLDTLQITADAVNNSIIAGSIEAAAEKVKSGKPLSDSLKNEDYIMPLLPQMIAIGEQSGKIDEMLGKVAQVYEDELDEQIRTLSQMIEPILMVLLAVVAGGIVGAVLFPIYALVNVI